MTCHGTYENLTARISATVTHDPTRHGNQWRVDFTDVCPITEDRVSYCPFHYRTEAQAVAAASDFATPKEATQ